MVDTWLIRQKLGFRKGPHRRARLESTGKRESWPEPTLAEKSPFCAIQQSQGSGTADPPAWGNQPTLQSKQKKEIGKNFFPP